MPPNQADEGADERIPLFTLIKSQSYYTQRVRDHQYAGSGTKEDPYQVEWLPNDPRNPLRMPRVTKWSITILQTLALFSITFASSALSAADPQIQAEFNSSPTLTIANTSLFILAFAVGPVIWAPLSELYGRQLIFAISFAGATLFSAVTIPVNSMAALLVLRFLAGTFGANAVSNSAAVASDLFEARERGIGLLAFIGPAFLGPTIAPIACNYLAVAAGWRWVQTLVTLIIAVVAISAMVFCPETYAPVLLKKRAQKLSKETGKVYMSKLEVENGEKTPAVLLTRAMTMPWVLLFAEPIGFLFAIYMAIIYGTLYMEFAAFPLVFEDARGWSQANSGLAFIGMGIGQIAGLVYISLDNKRYARIVDKTPNGHPPPETRLNPSLVAAITLPVGLFIFAWTNYPNIHWIACQIGTVLLGFSHPSIFLSGTSYLVDTYTIYAASATAANAVIRALFGAAFPLFCNAMYQRLGIHWGSSIPAFLALVCTPVPWLFYFYGFQIRQRCKYAAESARRMEQLLASSKTKEQKKQQQEEELEQDEEKVHESNGDAGNSSDGSAEKQST